MSSKFMILIYYSLLAFFHHFALPCHFCSINHAALPPELGALSTVKVLSFFDNKIRVPPPESLLKLKSLKQLYLQENIFRGSIDYLCPLREKNELRELRADCGVRKGLWCNCCTACGFNKNTAKGSMVFPYLEQ